MVGETQLGFICFIFSHPSSFSTRFPGQVTVSVQLGSPNTPGPRFGTTGASLTYLGGFIYLFGGADSQFKFDFDEEKVLKLKLTSLLRYGELWQYDLPVRLWKKVENPDGQDQVFF